MDCMISEETKTAILIDIARGKSNTEICNQYKISQGTLWNWKESYKDRIENYKQRLTDNFVDSKSASIIRQLEEENTQLKQQIEMLSIEKRALELALEKLSRE